MLPTTRTVDQTDDFFGTTIADPYRWLEQQRRPRGRPRGCPRRPTTPARISTGFPTRHRSRRPSTASCGCRTAACPLPPRPALVPHSATTACSSRTCCWSSDEPFGAPRVLIDPNTLGDASRLTRRLRDRARTASLVAYCYSEAGSDWRTWRVRRDRERRRPRRRRCAGRSSPGRRWLPDGSGFVYGAFDAPSGDALVSSNAGMRLMLHTLGDDSDEQVFALPDEPDVNFWPEITDDGRWLVVLGTRGTDPRARVWVADLAEGLELHPLIAAADAAWQLVGSLGDELVMLTDLDAPLSRLVAVGSRRRGPRTGRRASRPARGRPARRRPAGRAVAARRRRPAHRPRPGRCASSPTSNLPGLGSITELEARADDVVAAPRLDVVHRSAVGARPTTSTPTNSRTGFETPLDTDLVTEQVVRDEQGRHPGAAVPRPPSGRHAPPTGRTRPGSTATADSASR